MNVALCIFNRPELTAEVFRAIKAAQPEKLFLIADGPRTSRDEEACERARQVVQNVSWPCQVYRNFATVNLGCGRRLPTGLDWVFSQVEDAIVLEDDCEPNQDFFRFTQELLDYYRYDQRIGHIGGTNLIDTVPLLYGSYSFSRYTISWGWATWKRAWRNFDWDMKQWPTLRAKSWHYKSLGSSAAYFERSWDDICSGKVTSVWDAQWYFSIMTQGMVAIKPNMNLVANIGCGPGVDATHTYGSHFMPNADRGTMEFPLKHPTCVIIDEEADRRLAETVFRLPNKTLQLFRGTVFNRYWYGTMVRRLPFAGPLWTRVRKNKRSQG